MPTAIPNQLHPAADEPERRAPAAGLRGGEADFRHLVETASDIIYRADRTGHFTYANAAAVWITGYSREELAGKSFLDLVRPDYRERMLWLYSGQIEEMLPVTYFEFPCVTKEGGEVWIGQNVQLLWEDDEIVGVHAVARNITGQRNVAEALRESEERFRTVVESLGEGLVITDLEDTVLYVNSRMQELTGYSKEELLGRKALEVLLPPEEREKARRELRARRGGEEGRWEVEHQLKDGSRRPFRVNGVPYRNAEGEIVGTLGLVEDITDLRRAEAENQRLAALSRENPNPVLECDAEGRPVHVNPAATRIARELGQESVAGLLAENHAQLVSTCLGSGQGFGNVDVVVADRIFCWTYRPHLPGNSVHLFATDITGRRMMEEQLRHEALHDGLTGLPNRLLFMERLAHAILRAKRRPGYLFAVLFLDLDRFKVVNDSLGHHLGDELLGVVSQRLQKCLRTEDTVARFGGDEFAILLESIGDVSDATRIAERVLAELEAPVDLGGFEVFTSASIGIALNSTAYDRPELMLRNADMAMYRAKTSGAAFEVFDRTMHAQALARLQMETDLRRALERSEFRVHYQPIVALEDGAIRGVEALVRWMHPDRGWLMPEDFVPIAEETGLILPLGEWVLREACRQLKDWHDRFPRLADLQMGVNLSAKQLAQPQLVEQIHEVLRETGVAGERLRLEITESSIIENADVAVEVLERLKGLGVRISLDDFGTGYSSLSYLHRFPLDALKIDRSFVSALGAGGRSVQLVQTILSLGGSLGVAVVAEGIETAEQLQVLRDLGCELGQGFLFSEAAAAEEVEGRMGG